MNLLIALMIATHAMAASTVIEAPTAITKVTVYRDRALVARTASVTFPHAGDYTLLLRGVYGTDASHIFPSLRFSRMSDKITLGSSQILRVPRALSTEAKANVTALTMDLERLRREEKMVADDIHTSDKLLAAVDAMAAVVVSHAKTFDFEAMTRYHTARSNVSSQLRELRVAQSVLSLRIRSSEEALARHTADSSEEDCISVQVRVPGPAMEESKVSFEYIVPGASWRPRYNLRASVVGGTVGVEYHAVVSQHTPEEWANVLLDLSTAQPHVGSAPPVVTPWRLQREPPPQPRGRKMRASSVMESESVLMMAPRVDEAHVTSATGGSSVQSYSIPGRHSVPRGAEQRVAISHFDVSSTFQYVTSPALQTSAFLRAQCVNTSPFSLLPGEASVYDDTGFVATTSLASVLPSESFAIDLGLDDGIVVTHAMVKRARSDHGGFVVQKTITWDIAYDITIHNRKAVEAVVVVMDRIPVSSEESIVVDTKDPEGMELGKTTTDGVTTLSAVGVLEIKKVLGVGEKIVIPIRYAITHPSDVEVHLGF